MPRSHRTNAPPIQLFPFLDVFICTIGSLIVILVVVSQKVREHTVAKAVARHTQIVPSVDPERLALPAPLALPEPLALPDVESSRPIVSTADKERELDDARARLEDFERRVRKLDAIVRQRKAALASLQEQTQSLEAKSQNNSAQQRQLRQRIADTSQAQNVDLAELRSLRDAQARLRDKVIESQRFIAEHKRGNDGNSPHVIVPYDGATGTTRRPIILECTDDGIRFVAENINLTAGQLQHFGASDNPVLAGAQELVRFWTSFNSVQDKPEREPKPYVLIVVRPSGTLGYYVARGFLEEFGTDFGYELVTEDFQFEVPKSDPRATELCQAAINEALSQKPNNSNRRTESFSQALGDELKARALSGKVSPQRAGENGQGGAAAGSNKADGTFSSLTDSGRQPERFSSQQLARGGGTGSQKFFSSSTFRDHRDQLETSNGFSAERTSTGSGSAAAAGTPGSSGGAEPRLSTPTPQLSMSTNPRRATEPNSKPFAFTEGETPLVPESGNSGSGAGSDVGSKAGSLRRGPSASANGSGSSDASGSETGSSPRGTASTAGPGGSSEGDDLPAIAEPPSIVDLKPQPAKRRSPAKSSLAGRETIQEETLEQQKPAPSLMEGRDTKDLTSFKRQWGIPNSKGSIALEKSMSLRLNGERIVIADRFKITRTNDRKWDELAGLTTQAMDVVAREWGVPPSQFYWVPAVDLVVEPGGDLMLAPLKKRLEQAGVSVRVQYE